MITLVLRLTVIALLVYAGVAYWYDRVEQGLQGQKPPAVREETQPSAIEEQKATVATNDYQVILSRNIFKAMLDGGGPGRERSKAELDDLSETKLRLALLGTVTGDKDEARAIIRDEKTKLEDLYRVGAEVQGAVIARITRGKVVLQVNGREEVLTIRDPEQGESRVQVGSRPESRMSEAAPALPGREMENKVPEAQPRRRISFRNTGGPPPQIEKPVGPAAEQSPQGTGDSQPVAEDPSAVNDAAQDKPQQ